VVSVVDPECGLFDPPSPLGAVVTVVVVVVVSAVPWLSGLAFVFAGLPLLPCVSTVVVVIVVSVSQPFLCASPKAMLLVNKVSANAPVIASALLMLASIQDQTIWSPTARGVLVSPSNAVHSFSRFAFPPRVKELGSLQY
jgi:hypothetical protein